MLYNLIQPKTELARLHEIPKTFFEKIEDSKTFGNHLFPDWFEEVCGSLHGLEKKFKSLFENYKAIGDIEARKQIIKAFEINNKVKELCDLSLTDREINKSAFPENIANDLDDIFHQLYHSTLEYDKFEAKVNTNVHEFIRLYIKLNKHSLCPFCGFYSCTYIKGEARLALDHWLCKDYFPQASVNFSNLVPICEKCNKSPVKGNRIILDYPEGEVVRSKSLYPYLGHSGFQVKFSFHYIPSTSDFSVVPFTLVITPINVDDNEVITNWKSVFNIQTRFESYLGETVFEMWENNLEGYCTSNKLADKYDNLEFKSFLTKHKNNYYHKNNPGYRLNQAFWEYMINETDEPYVKSIYDNLKSKLNV
jgi:hypothetical protein